VKLVADGCWYCVGYVKANNAFAQDAMDKLQIAEKRSNPDSVYGER
jgi:hypothetical protein